jgi:glycosyltransferase involved in cell wall biosynthesis
VAHLHAHFAHDPALIAQIAHKLVGIPYSFTAHARDLLQVPRAVLRERIQQASAVVTCCRTNLDYLEEVAPGERHKFSLVYHGVNLEGFQPAARPAAPPGEPPLVLSVGRLVEKKGYLDLFEALRRVKDGGARFRCEIYGDGPQRAELEARLTALGLAGEVVLAGTRTQAELIPIYQRAALFALAPTVTEDGDRDGIPNALAEAMAVGLPVVVTRVGGIPEIVSHGREGLLYTPHDAAGLAEGIAALLGSEPMRRALGQAARRQVCEHFDLAQAALRLKDLFARVLSPAAIELGDAAALPQVPVTHEP